MKPWGLLKSVLLPSLTGWEGLAWRDRERVVGDILMVSYPLPMDTTTKIRKSLLQLPSWLWSESHHPRYVRFVFRHPSFFIIQLLLRGVTRKDRVTLKS